MSRGYGAVRPGGPFVVGPPVGPAPTMNVPLARSGDPGRLP